MKRTHLLFFMSLLSLVHTNSQMMPKLSNSSVSSYYNIRFKNGGAVIQDMGSGNALLTAVLSPTNLSQQWKIEEVTSGSGTYYLTSRLGNKMNFVSNFTGSATGISLYLRATTNASYKPAWEISRTASGACMNQWGGPGAGKALGEYSFGDGGNPLEFLFVEDIANDALNLAISDAIYQLNTLTAAGNNPGQYSTTARTEFQAAINVATTVSKDAAATTAQRDAAAATLGSAKTAYLGKFNPIRLSTAGNDIWYYIVNAGSNAYCNGMVMVNVGSTAGTAVQFTTKSVNPLKLWRFVDAGNGKIAIQNRASNLYVAVPGNSSTPIAYTSNFLGSDGQFSFNATGQNPLHAQQAGSYIVTWAGGLNSPSAWKLEELPAGTKMPLLISTQPQNGKPMYYGSKLSWETLEKGPFDVYISANLDSVKNATQAFRCYRGRVSTANLDIASLKLLPGTKYYWRVDAQSGDSIMKGEVNMFINPLLSAPYHAMRSGLRNAAIRFKNQKQGRVAFLGGSITYNPGWRDSICNYLKKRFPETTFDFIAAGIPSMGSTPGAFRMERDVLSRGQVDLLFEEAAVNDGPSANNFPKIEQIRAMEGIARHSKLNNPNMDVVFMYFADPDKLARYNEGKTPDVIINHDSVAKVYDVPAINIAKEVTDRINAGEFTWANDIVDLHPSAFGQAVYFRSMKAFLDSAWSKPVTTTDAMVPHTLPAKIDPDCYDSGYLVGNDKGEPSTKWVVNPKWVPTDGAGTREDYTNVPMLIGSTPDSILTFKFNGKAVGISVASGPDAGIILSSVDGSSWKTTDLFTGWSAGLHLPWYFTLYSTLPEGNHVLRIKLSASKNASSKGTVCRIRYFFVSGTSLTSGLSLSSSNDNVLVYPNPAKGYIEVNPVDNQPFTCMVFDNKGCLLTQRNNCAGLTRINVNTKGIAYVTIQTKSDSTTKKIIFN